MPELPEVEVIIRGLQQNIVGKTISAIPLISPHVTANLTAIKYKKKLINQKIIAIRRQGKFIIIELNGDYLVIHLRMTGKLILAPLNIKPGKHTAFIFNLDNQSLVFDDMRKFGRIWLTGDVENLPPLKKLGPDALTINLAEFKRICHGKLPIKNFIMQQEKISGLGNIYASEILFLAGVHPQTSVADLSEEEIKQIHKHIKPVLQRAIKAGGTSISDYVNSAGVPGEFQKILNVYKRDQKPCLKCNTSIERIKMAGRSTFFCPNCQIKH